MLETLKKYEKKGLISLRPNEDETLFIANYTPKVQYEQLWDSITLQCRGLVVDDKGVVVARPFSKFFNIEEIDRTELPQEPFEVFDKKDGSLGIGFWHQGEFIITTRGSFISEQAQKAKQLLKKYPYKQLPKPYTYLFEIIYPENQIVVDYHGQSKLVLLAIIQTHTKKEVPFDLFSTILNPSKWDIVDRYEGLTDFVKIKRLNWENKEGMVVKFQSGYRIKIKFEEYIRLHKILTGVTEKIIWQALTKNQPLSKSLNNIPDEAFQFIKETETKLIQQFEYTLQQARTLLDRFQKQTPKASTKTTALWIQQQNKKLQPVLFALFNHKPYSQIIWKQLKPKATSTTV